MYMCCLLFFNRHHLVYSAPMFLCRSMPDVELLMQEWPNQFEQLLATVNLPSSSLDCTLSEYVDIICGETIGHVMSPWHNKYCTLNPIGNVNCHYLLEFFD